MDSSGLIRLIEASVEELIEFHRTRAYAEPYAAYVRALLAFHRGDAKALASEKTGDPLIDKMIRIRFLIVSGETDFTGLMEAPDASNPWHGEYLILIATAHTVMGDHVSAKASFEEAARAFHKLGAHGKALRSESNVIVAMSNIDPERKFLPEYHYLFRRAKKAGQWLVAATALLNLSREYQKMGALKLALKTANQGIKICRGNVASQIFYLLIAHRAHLFFQMKRTIEAESDLELARTSDDRGVKQACAVLEELFQGRTPEADSPILPVIPTWQERLEEYRRVGRTKKPALSSQEEALLSFLSEKSREKFEICDHVFGKDVHPFIAENRLKNLLGRIRKKFPGLVVFDDDRYFITDSPSHSVKKSS